MKANEGFSLLEAVVSTAILGLSCGALVTTSNATYRTLERAHDQSRMAAILDARLDEVDSDLGLLLDKENGFSGDGRIRWDQTTETIKPPDGSISGLALQRVIVTARWIDGAEGDPVTIEVRHLSVSRASQ